MDLPLSVIAARDKANLSADAHHAAWVELESIKEPTHLDVERWLAVREKFYSAQGQFERLLWQSLGR